MNNQKFLTSLSCALFSRRTLILVQFFLIIFVYHTLKDLKDSIVITASEAGAEVIPFIKIWAMLPLAIASSYIFTKLYNKYGRNKSLYMIMSVLLSSYMLFAFLLYPLSSQLFLNNFSQYLMTILPNGAKGFVAMISFWHFTFFYLMAELWSVLVLSILFWGYVNATTSLSDAAKFYPLCMFVGNFAGIISGQISHYISHHLTQIIAWQSALQMITLIVVACGLLIMVINRQITLHDVPLPKMLKEKKPSLSFKDSLLGVVNTPSVACIAILVVGFGITSNLIEVVWKENIKALYPLPHEYNAYINQLTSMIGVMAVCMALTSRWLLQALGWTRVALLTPFILFATSSCFFAALLLPQAMVAEIAAFFGVNSLCLVVMLGSFHYVLGLSAKYTIFDTTKEMAFLSIEAEERMQAKSIIDSIGSRLGKSGSSTLYQFLLIVFGSTAGHISIIGFFSIAMISISMVATKKLGGYLNAGEKMQSQHAAGQAIISQV